MKSRLNIYVDGFNLYYCALKRTPYKWLDIKKLCQLYFPKFVVNEIKYFTADVKPRPHNPQQDIRQQIYLRALKTIPNMSIIKGSYQEKVKPMPASVVDNKGKKYLLKMTFKGLLLKLPLARTRRPQRVHVIKSEEKGSDVNLATYLLRDAYRGKFDGAVVISNDADLKEPIRIVNSEIKLPVYILNPDKTDNRKLAKVARYVKQIRQGALKDSQFPDTLSDSIGEFTKPNRW